MGTGWVYRGTLDQAGIREMEQEGNCILAPLTTLIWILFLLVLYRAASLSASFLLSPDSAIYCPGSLPFV